MRIRITVRIFTGLPSDGCVGGAVVLPIKLGWTYSFATRKLFGHRNSLIPRPNVTVLRTTQTRITENQREAPEKPLPVCINIQSDAKPRDTYLKGEVAVRELDAPPCAGW